RGLGGCAGRWRSVLFATRSVESLGKFFKPINELKIPGLLSMGRNILITLCFPQRVFEPLQNLINLVCTITTPHQIECFFSYGISGNSGFCFVGLPGAIDKIVHWSGMIAVIAIAKRVKWRGRWRL